MYNFKCVDIFNVVTGKKINVIKRAFCYSYVWTLKINLSLFVLTNIIKHFREHRVLGVTNDDELQRQPHIHNVRKQVAQNLFLFGQPAYLFLFGQLIHSCLALVVANFVLTPIYWYTGPSSVRRTLEPFQRQRWENCCHEEDRIVSSTAGREARHAPKASRPRPSNPNKRYLYAEGIVEISPCRK